MTLDLGGVNGNPGGDAVDDATDGGTVALTEGCECEYFAEGVHVELCLMEFRGVQSRVMSAV